MRSHAWLAVVVPALLVGCSAGHVERAVERHTFAIQRSAEANPWTHLAARNDPAAFQFAIVSDRNGGMRPGVFADAVDKVNLLQPEFVMCVGDLIPGYTEDESELERQWSDFIAIAEGFEMPFFYLPGNHDISNPVMAADWHRRFGRSYYHFVYGDVLFLCLNSEDQRPGHISEEQVDYVARALAENADVRWTMAFLHKPLWLGDPPDSGWAAVESLLEPRPHTVFAGHVHSYTSYRRHGRDYIVLATTGGGSGLEGPLYGTFDHIVWITMGPDGPRIANLMLDGIWGKDVFTEEMARLLAAARRGDAVTVSPIFADTATFEAAATELRLVNPAEQEMTVKIAFRPQETLRVDPDALELVVPAGSEQAHMLKIDAVQPRPADQVPALLMDWEVAYDLPGRQPVTMSGTTSIGVAAVSVCPRRAAPVVVDGRLDEWDRLPLSCVEPRQISRDRRTWRGPADGSFKFAVEHDEEYVYVAVATTDDDLMLDPGRLPWQQDGVEVRLDARPEPQRSAGRGRGEFTDVLLVALSPGLTPEQMVVYGRERLPEGVKAVCVATEGGYSTEIAVPVRYLNEKQGGPWEAFRLNIAVDDFDGDFDAGAQLWWRPDWRTPMNYAGSGTFVRR